MLTNLLLSGHINICCSSILVPVLMGPALLSLQKQLCTVAFSLTAQRECVHTNNSLLWAQKLHEALTLVMWMPSRMTIHLTSVLMTMWSQNNTSQHFDLKFSGQLSSTHNRTCSSLYLGYHTLFLGTCRIVNSLQNIRCLVHYRAVLISTGSIFIIVSALSVVWCHHCDHCLEPKANFAALTHQSAIYCHSISWVWDDDLVSLKVP